MEYIKEVRQGVDAGHGTSCNLHPANGEGRVGKHGLDKDLTLEQVILLARNMEEKPNIIIKSGKNAKWYLKRFTMEELPSEIEKQQQWKAERVARCTMFIIENE
jgi:hypothetical protein